MTPFLPIALARQFARSRQHNPADRCPFHVRVAVVQTAFPSPCNFTKEDRELNDPSTRRTHRRHLSSVLGGVRRMLLVRDSHLADSRAVELVVLPELAVHPDDVQTILIPFARQHSCAIYTGVVFHPARPGGPLINASQWILPVRSKSGLQFQHVMQGKYYLTEDEKKLDIASFRPAQWLLEFADPSTGEPSWSMSGAICYDATDLCLAADLRDKTDLFLVPALNRDVGTFDNMVAALHYHMFQHVIVANSGGFGGSTAQAPFDDRNSRTIFHSHGGEQVAISFFDIDLGTYRDRKRVAGTPGPAADPLKTPAASPLKTPPAGYCRGR